MTPPPFADNSCLQLSRQLDPATRCSVKWRSLRGESNGVDERQEYVAVLRGLQDAADELQRAMEVFSEATADVARQVEAGGRVGDALQQQHWPSVRRRVELAWVSFQEALYTARCFSIGIMVDDEGMTISEIARSRKLSRQLISRLYGEWHSRVKERMKTEDPTTHV